MREKDYIEYALLVIKPDGLEKKRTNYILEYFKEQGLTEVLRYTQKISKMDVDDIFQNVHNYKNFNVYLSRGDMTAVLLKGENAYKKLRLLKVELRKQLNAGVIENLIHSSEAGNEYDLQFTKLLPGFDISKFTLYADMYCKVPFPTEYEPFVLKLENIKHRDSVKSVAFVFPNQDLQSYVTNMERYRKEYGISDNYMLGVEYNTSIENTSIRILGYYPFNEKVKNLAEMNEYTYQIEDVVAGIERNGGTPFLSYNPNLGVKDNSFYKQLRSLGVRGALAYHPQYTLKETESLRELYFNNDLFVSGGSGGLTEPGRFGISIEIFNNIYKLLYGCDY